MVVLRSGSSQRRWLAGWLALNLVIAQYDVERALIGVSGTLQEGFPLHHQLDYHIEHRGDGATTTIPAIKVGRALVRGYKAYLDVKQPGWREYQASPLPPQVPNAVVLPTGCHAHANIFHIYAVAAPHVLNILAGEPRFLSITPDTGLVDLTSTYTDESVRQLAMTEIHAAGLTQSDVVAIPLVTGVYLHDSYVESPTFVMLQDGTNVTSFTQSLALWANVSATDMVHANDGAASQQTWSKVYEKARQAERDQSSFAQTLPVHDCRAITRFGVSADQLRLNYPLPHASIAAATQIAPHRDEL